MFLLELVMNNEIPKSYYALFLFMIVSSIFCQMNFYINWDNSWQLEAASRLLAGGSYSQHFIESNPPLSLYLYSLPVLLNSWIGSLSLSFFIFIYGLIILSLSLSYSLLKTLIPTPQRLMQFMLGLAFCELLLPSFEFGQREHLCFILIFPYLLVCALRCNQQKIMATPLYLSSLMAGIGFAIKPHFLIPLIFIVLWVAWKKGSIKSFFYRENIGLFLIMLLYLISVFIITPDYIYFILPLVYHFYLNYDKTAFSVLLVQIPVIISFISLILAGLQLRQKNGSYYSNLMQILIVANLGFLLIYLLQAQAWYYHLIPTLSLSFLLLLINSTLIFQRISTEKPYPIKLYINLALTIACLTQLISFIFGLSITHIDRKLSTESYINQIMNSVKKINQGPFMVLSTSMEPNASLLHYTKLHSSARMNCYWLLPGIIHLEKTADTKAIEQAKQGRLLLQNIIIEDIKRDPPHIILIDESKEKYYLGNSSFDYLIFLKQNPEFRELWKQYRFKTKVNDYAIYVHHPLSTPPA